MTQIEFLCILNQIKLFHWNTKSYAAHIAFAQAYKKLEKNIDAFVEMWQGEYGLMPTGSFEKEQVNKNDEAGIAVFFNDTQDFLLIDVPQNINKDTDKDLLNKRDDILGCLSILKYLLTLS
jgi:hypothetical protein